MIRQGDRAQENYRKSEMLPGERRDGSPRMPKQAQKIAKKLKLDILRLSQYSRDHVATCQMKNRSTALRFL